MDCKKCQSGGRTSPTFKATSTYINDPVAEVQVTQSAYVDSQYGTQRLMLGEIVKLQYGLIAELLRANCDTLYFKKPIELATFLVMYPDLKGCAS